MSDILQGIMIVGAVGFTVFVIYMVFKESLSLRYSLPWLGIGLLLICIGIFPDIVFALSRLLHIITPVNALYLIIIFFLIIVVFLFSISISKLKKQITTLVQEIALLRNSVEDKKKDAL